MNKGFTLVELMVSIAVIAIMTGALLINWHPTEDSFALRRSAAGLIADLKKAQQFSLSTKESGCVSPPGDGYSGFGIYLSTSSPNSYLLYENCNSNYQQDAGEAIETIELENGVTIHSLNDGGGVTTLDLLFISPDPDIYINQSGLTSKVGTIELEGADGSTETVTINTSGKIE